ncbi:MAG: acyl-CoA carboxylase subunit beta, partial [Candidatus Paceibacterota bacterium]|jgi:acetyl-CoA carboxylase carboxyltransferase component
MSLEEKIKKLNARTAALDSAEMAAKQHEKGKLTARERIIALLDKDSFIEINSFAESCSGDFGMDQKKFPGDAVISGFGKINDRQVCIYSQDFSKIGGSLGEMHGQKIIDTIQTARKTGCPVIGLIDSGGARIQEGIASLDGYAGIFREMVKASGIVPQISVILGPSAGGASYAPGLSDFVFMVEGISQMYITGPEVIKSVTGEQISFDGLGGASIHALQSGCAHFIFKNEKTCLENVKKLLDYLPQNNMENSPAQDEFAAAGGPCTRLLEIVPQEENKGYDMKEVIKEIFDQGSFLEVQAGYAPNSITGLARLGGQVAGVVANQTKTMAGTLDVNSSDKIARFVRLCDAFNIPIINLIDTPGYLPGADQEHKGIIRHGAKVLYAYAEASVPKISLILRKAFGGAYIALASRELGYDKVIAWPSAQIGVMGPQQAVKIIFRKDLAKSKDPGLLEKEKIAQLAETFLSPWQAAKLGKLDMIIDPKETRSILLKLLGSLLNKREARSPRKHGNIPL